MPNPTQNSHKKIPIHKSFVAKVFTNLRRREQNAINIYSLSAFAATIVALLLFFQVMQQETQELIVIDHKRISLQAILYLSVLIVTSFTIVLCLIAAYKAPGMVARLFLVCALLINFCISGLNMFNHAWVGGFEHYRFAIVEQPDLSSSALKDARYVVKERQNTSISSLSTELDLVLLDSGHIDKCVHGFEGGLGKPGTGYAYKCIYRTNRYFGIKRDFPGAIRDINYGLLKKDWRAGEAFYVLGEYENRTKEGYIKNVVNSLPGLSYYKNKQMIEIDYADLDLAKQDESYPVELAIGDISQIISGGDNGTVIYEDEKIVESAVIVQKAKAQSLQYIIVLSSEEEYFINY